MFARVHVLMLVSALLVSIGLVSTVSAGQTSATGIWKSGDVTLKLAQDGENLTGVIIAADGTESVITDGSVTEEGQVSFTVGASRYTGKLEGDVITGTVTTDDSEVPWKATRAVE